MVFNSFEALGSFMGFMPAKAKKEKAVFCRVCGCRMHRVPGSNVMLCSGKTDDGARCTNRLLLSTKK